MFDCDFLGSFIGLIVFCTIITNLVINNVCDTVAGLPMSKLFSSETGPESAAAIAHQI